MTECRQTCYQCLDERTKGPRKWVWLCEDCADENEHKHRRETGHTCETVITRPDAPGRKVFGMIADASRLMGRRGW